METCIFQVASNFSDAGGIRRAVLPPGGTDTCTLRGEDCQYCGAFIEAPCSQLQGIFEM
jgi:hypothetical protein